MRWYVVVLIPFGHTLSHQEGKAALLRAASTGNTAAVRRELKGHTDINSQDEVGFSPFSCSIAKFHFSKHICLGWYDCNVLCCIQWSS